MSSFDLLCTLQGCLESSRVKTFALNSVRQWEQASIIGEYSQISILQLKWLNLVPHLLHDFGRAVMSGVRAQYKNPQ